MNILNIKNETGMFQCIKIIINIVGTSKFLMFTVINSYGIMGSVSSLLSSFFLNEHIL